MPACRDLLPLSFSRCLPGLALVLLAVSVPACGGSDPADPVPDAAVLPPADGGGTLPDAQLPPGDAEAPVATCTPLSNGSACGEGGICIDAICTPSRCGDGVLDPLLGEECEDANELSGDGCSLCRFECKANTDCNDGVVCNGAETCDLINHTCVLGAPAMAGTACMIDATTAGVCHQATCVSPGCGNGAMDAGEECDDGNGVDTDGCTTSCKFTCSQDADCDNGNACDGAETCQVATHTCKAGTAVVCNANGCMGTCDPGTGMCAYPDADKDGSSCDLDCSDADPARFPSGFECADGKDNDCNEATKDVGAPSCLCYLDKDKDGFAADVTGAIASGGSCPEGYTYKKPIDAKTIDCGPNEANAFPGQTKYFATAYCQKAVGLCFTYERVFDYNCDTKTTALFSDNWTGQATCVGAKDAVSCFARSGWVGATPACGGKSTYRSCTFKDGVCLGSDIPNRARACR